MKRNSGKSASKPVKTKAVMLRLPEDLVQAVQEFARANNIKPSAVYPIALTRILKTGL